MQGWIDGCAILERQDFCFRTKEERGWNSILCGMFIENKVKMTCSSRSKGRGFVD